MALFSAPPAPAAAASSAEVRSVIEAKVSFVFSLKISISLSPSFWANKFVIFFKINSKIFPSLSLNSIFKSSSTKVETNFTSLGTLIISVLFKSIPSKENVFLPFTSTTFDKLTFWPYLLIEIIFIPLKKWTILYQDNTKKVVAN